MDRISCQYCSAELSMAEVEKESGICPECGSMISGASLFDSIDDTDFDEDSESSFDDDDEADFLDDEDDDDFDDDDY